MTPANALATLIDDARAANGWSDEDVAERARGKGHGLSKSAISEIRTKGLATIVPAKLRAIADGIGMPLVEVTRAALDTVGLPYVEGLISLEDAVQRDPDLPLFTKRQWIATIEMAREEAHELRLARAVAKGDSVAALEAHMRKNSRGAISRRTMRSAAEAVMDDPTQYAGTSGTAPLPTPKKSDHDLAANAGDASQGMQQRQRDAQDDFYPDEDGPEGGA